MNDTEDAPWGSVETRFEAIHSAARMRNAPAVQKELAEGVPVDIENGRAKNGDGVNTALWYAAQGAAAGGLAVAKVLIDAGAVVNKSCEHGWTALHMAACWGHLDVARLLVDNGADWTKRDVMNRTPRELADVSNCVEREKLQRVSDYLATLERCSTTNACWYSKTMNRDQGAAASGP